MNSDNASVTIIKPRKEPVQARSRARFQRILDVAVGLIVDKGVDAVAMSEIAEAAKISIASLYQYFPDKAAIIGTLAHRFNNEGQTCVHDIFAVVSKPEHLIEALNGMIDSYFAFFRDVPGSYAIWQATQSDTRLQAIDLEDMEFHAQTIAVALKRAKPGILVNEARQLGRVLTGIIASTVRSASTMTPEEGQAMVDICKRTVLAPAIERVLEPV